MEKCSPPVGTIKEFLNCSPSWKDCMDLSGTIVKPQYWEVWQQVLLPTPQYKVTDATPPKVMLDDIQICVVSLENSSNSFKEKEANTEGMVGIDCVITVEEEVEVQGKSSPESRIELRDDIKICIVPELQDEAPFMVIDGGRTKGVTNPVKDRGLSRVEKATQTEVTQMEMAKICEDYIQKAEGAKVTLWDNHQANVVSRNNPRDSEGGMIHLREPDGIGEPEEAACNTLTDGDKGDEEEEETAILKKGGIVMESARQSFRWYCYPESEGPRKAYRQLLDLCHHWLKPERHSKEQILELLVLEQFLAILPKEIQSWVWQQHPERFPTYNPDLILKMGRNENQELEKHQPHHLAEGASPEVTGELEFSDEKGELATWREDVLTSGPTSPRPFDSCDATVKGRRQKARSRWQQTVASFACPDCGKAFLSKADLARHQWYHSQKKPYQSLSRPKSFAKPSQLARHQPRQPGECKCAKCGKRFRNRNGLARHQAIHSAKRPFHRHAHHRGFSFNYNLRQHQNQQVPAAEPVFHCPECGRQFTRRCNLIQHSRIHQYQRQPQGKQEVDHYPGDQTQ
ncbi:hypothetical protein Chor_009506 [Crotalus horridus]